MSEKEEKRQAGEREREGGERERERERASRIFLPPECVILYEPLSQTLFYAHEKHIP